MTEYKLKGMNKKIDTGLNYSNLNTTSLDRSGKIKKDFEKFFTKKELSQYNKDRSKNFILSVSSIKEKYKIKNNILNNSTKHIKKNYLKDNIQINKEPIVC